MDANGLLGVACTGFLLEKISEITLGRWVIFSTELCPPVAPLPTCNAHFTLAAMLYNHSPLAIPPAARCQPLS